MSKSSIEWTEETWNPIVGCSIVSPGCTNCYAMKMAARIEAMGNQPRYAGTTRKVNGNAVWTGKLAQAPESTLLAPLRRKKPTTYFVNSMGDLFHEDCPDEWIDRVFAVMALSPHHAFQVLTKRAARMRDYCLTLGRHHESDRVSLAMKQIHADHGFGASGAFYTMGETGWHFKNIWLGVSTERQQEWDERTEHLRNTPAAVRFVSAEPLLGPIEMRLAATSYGFPQHIDRHGNAHGMPHWLHWVIVGGESGPKARPMHPAWARSLRDQCKAAGVPLFFKQWGNWKPLDQFETQVINSAGKHAVVRDDGRFTIDTDVADPPRAVFTFNMGKKGAGRALDGELHNAMPEIAR